MRSRPARPVLIAGLLAGLLLLADAPVTRAQAAEGVDLSMVTRLRQEGLEHSQVMDTLWWLTDRYGPRLTNSPQQRHAADWAVQKLQEWGLENVHLEPWGEFGLGWSYERCEVSMVEPDTMPMIALPQAWTSGLDGPVEGEPILVEAEEPEDLDAYAGRLAGKIVLFGQVEEVPSDFDATAERYDAQGLEELAAAPDPDERSPWEDRRAEFRRRWALSRAFEKLIDDEHPLVVLQPDSARQGGYGVITLGSAGSRDPEDPRALPRLVVATEQWNRVARLLQHEQPVTLRVDVRTTFHDDDLQGANIIAEIPGADPELKDELVMLGAHFDSWHPATGATDNGCCSAVVMEVMRLLETVGVHPRRTVRMALWTGEEQGLLGSRGYVSEHFADPETMELRPEHARLSAYFNLDNGGGRIRGVYLQGNAAVAPIFASWLQPFHDLGATTLTMRDTGGTDHLSFDAVGLPGFQFIQDPLDYDTRTHHTNMDLYERVHPGDVAQAAVIMASCVYDAAMRDGKLPRKPLPAPRPPREERHREEAPAEAPAEQPAAPITEATGGAPAPAGAAPEAAEGADADDAGEDATPAGEQHAAADAPASGPVAPAAGADTEGR